MSNLEGLAAPIQGDPDKRFEPVRFLGRGNFGFVELCKDLEKNNKFVVRKIANVVATTETEIVTLYRSKHQNIIKFYGYYTKNVDQALMDREKIAVKEMNEKYNENRECTMKLNEKVYCLIIEFGEGGDLGKYITSRNSIEEIILLKFITQITQALQFLNQNLNMHRDIKPANILLDKYGNAKLADFGTATQLGENQTHRVFTFTQGTDMYTAPEITYHFKYNEKYNYLVDIFSTGCVFYYACNGKIDEKEIGNIKENKPKNISELYYTAQFNELIMKMVCIDPKQRANAAYVLDIINQFKTPKQLDENQQKSFLEALNLLNGIDGVVDKKQAIEIFESISKSTDFDCPETIYQLAKCNLYGNGMKKNLNQAIGLLRLSSRKQHIPSLKLLAFCYKYGIGVEKDLFTTIQLLTIAQKNDPEVSFLLGLEYYNSKVLEINDIRNQSKIAVKRDYELAFDYFSQVKNYPPAQNFLGLCYLHGHGTKQDLLEAYKYLSLSVEGGYVDGKYNLAEYYLTHKEDDEFCTKKAIELLTDAAHQYHMGAAFKLSEIYSQGKIVPQDLKKASYYSKMNSNGINEYDSEYSFALFKMNGRKEIERNAQEVFSRLSTMAENHPGAMYQLGKIHNNGIGIKKDCEEASDLFEKASDKGIHDATCDFALCLLRGSGHPADKEKAIELLTKTSELGCRYAKYILAQCYLNGEGVQEDKAHGIELLRSSHSDGYTDATYLLAHCIRNGEGINPDEYGVKTLEESRKLFKIAALKGHAKASYELGMIFNQTNELFVYKQKAFQLFEVAGNQNYPQALTELGIFNELGICTRKNPQRAFKLYQKAVNLGDVKGLYHLGMCYVNGTGVTSNFEKGRNLLENASSKDIVDAKYQLGLLYFNGLGGPKDLVQAAQLFEQAANNGNVDAKVSLGKCLFNGIGIKTDRFKARRLFEEAKNANNIEGSFQLALIYMNGIDGKRKNVVDAKLILNDLIDRQHLPSMFVLGKYYVESGQNNEEIAEGISLLKTAEKNGSSDAINFLGVCFLTGKGVDKNPEKAVEKFKTAIKEGNNYAKTNLAICYIDSLAYTLPKDEERGYKLLTEAPEDDISAKFRIGVCLYKGIGVQENKEEGIKLIKETADLQEANAMCYYGKMLLKGSDVDKDVKEGFRYLEEASKKGQPESLYQIGLILENGLEEIEKNEIRAYGSLQRSSDAGFVKASYYLGKIFINDPNRKIEGVQLFEKAALLRHPEAAKELERIYREGDGIDVDEDKASDYSKMANDPEFGKIPQSMLASTRNHVKEEKPKKLRTKMFKFGGIKSVVRKKKWF